MNLWTTKDIALLLKTNVKSVGAVVKRPDFPAPTIALGPRLRRWSEASVLGWIEKQQIRNAR